MDEFDNNSTVEAQDNVEAEATENVIQNDSWETMSDEDFASLDYEQFAQTATTEEENEDNQEEESEVENDGIDAEDEDDESLEDFDAGSEQEDAQDSGDPSEEDEGTVKYKEAYKKIFAPFKANGHEIKVDSPDDVVRLMQMGANYNAKMAALKPSLKTLKLLEKHQLLDENKLAVLIDASKGNPEAVKQLIQAHKIDVYNLDLDNESDYKPQIETVSDKEYNLSEVMDSLKENPHYEKTLNVVTKVWDTESKQVVVNEPRLLETINQHIASGMYDIVQAEVAKQRTLGRLQGVSDIVAYKQIGDMLDEQGAFDHLASKGGSTTSEQRQPIARKPRSPAKAATNNTEKRKSASHTRQTVQTTKGMPEGFNPLEMSDDDFEKNFDPRLM